jgi:membrane protein required for beta-lactamase induction
MKISVRRIKNFGYYKVMLLIIKLPKVKDMMLSGMIYGITSVLIIFLICISSIGNMVDGQIGKVVGVVISVNKLINRLGGNHETYRYG